MRCLAVLLLVHGAMHVSDFHLSCEVGNVTVCLASAVGALMGSVESARVAIPPVVVSLDRVRGIRTIIVAVASTAPSTTIVASTISSVALALIVV